MMPSDDWGWKACGPDFGQAGLQGNTSAVMMPGGMPGSMPGGHHDMGLAPGYAVSYSWSPVQGQLSGCSEQGMTFASGYAEQPGIESHGQMQGQTFGNDPGAMGMAALCPQSFGSNVDIPVNMGAWMPHQQQPSSSCHFTNAGMPSSSGAMPQDDQGYWMQTRAEYEWQMHSKDEKVRNLQTRLGLQEAQRAKMQSDFERDRKGLVDHLHELAEVVESYGITVDAPSNGSRATPSSARLANRDSGTLDSKMVQLNSLLQHGQDKTSQGRGKPSNARSKGSKGSGPSSGQRRDKGSQIFGKGGPVPGSSVLSASSRQQVSIVSRPAAAGPNVRGSSGPSSKLRVSFPDDLEQPIHGEVDLQEGEESPSCNASCQQGAEEVERAAKGLEHRAGSGIDQQAMGTLRALSANDALEALRRAEDLVIGQGDHPQKLSSILQSVCRKIKRRDNGGRDNVRGHAEPALEQSPRNAPPQKLLSRGAVVRSGVDLWKPPADPEEMRTGAKSSEVREQKQSKDGRDNRHRPLGVRPLPGTVCFGEQRFGSGGAWSTGRFEQLARQGSFILERGDESMGSWSLKIRMQDLEPQLTDDDMQVYCRWLHHRLHGVRQELGLKNLRHVQTEVNFSKNGLTDNAVARLLQALQRSELHIVCLNLHANRITPVGARHIGDFIWETSSNIREVHLSHNEMDDEAALEMIRLLADHPKYQPRRCGNGSGEWQHPVWLRFNNNFIENPRMLLRVLENELGIPFCLARNRHTCGPSKCGWNCNSSFPLVHLYTFEVQNGPCPATPGASPAEQRAPHRDKSSAVCGKAPRRRAVPAGGRILEEDEEAPESATAPRDFSKRSNIVARILPSKFRDRDAAGAQSCVRQTLDPLGEEDSAEESLSSPPKDEEILFESGIVRSDCSTTDACRESEEKEAPSEKPSLDAAVPSAAEVSSPQITKVLVGQSISSATPLRGVPEVTPEPDSQVAGGHPATGAAVKLHGDVAKTAAVPEEEEDTSPLPVKKTKLKSPPKILQRGKAPPEGLGPALEPCQDR